MNKTPGQVVMRALEKMKWVVEESRTKVRLQTGRSRKGSDPNNKKAPATPKSEKTEVKAGNITCTTAFGQERNEHIQEAGKGPVWPRL